MAAFAALDAERASDMALLAFASTAASCSGLTVAQAVKAPKAIATTAVFRATVSVFCIFEISYRNNRVSLVRESLTATKMMTDF
ncbi:MAG: hypothetical protein ACU85U_06675 [Gammaproteobacteria bacterium]